MADPLHARRHLLVLFRPFIAAWMRRVTNYRVVTPPPANRNNPFLLISNHVSIYDLALALLQLEEMPVIVIHEIFQRNPIVAWLLRPLGLIWKQADLHDAKTIRQMKRAAAAGRSILLYPEGDLTWTGDTGELPDALSRLIKYVSLPVVVLTEKGAYMTYSRWAGNVRKGSIELHFQPCISSEELKTLSDPEMMEKLSGAFRHSEHSWLQSLGNGLSFAADRQARDVSKMLFLCPVCGSAGRIINSDTSVSCLECGFNAGIGPSLELDEETTLKTGLGDIWQWHDWQIEKWEHRVRDASQEGSLALSSRLSKAELLAAIGNVNGIVTGAGFHSRFLKRPVKFSAAEATIGVKGITVKSTAGVELLNIPTDKMLSVRVLPMRIYKPNWLLLSTKEGYYKLMFEGPAHPAYLWCTTLKQLIGQLDTCADE